jgi:hypothetical protein|mmetsp:Transcript_25295/g.39977  ORF Transcript_25295/g.39977 Transcript_25295/m.39977 type:complete len:407 (-) Transcript_25295:69-1289(-)
MVEHEVAQASPNAVLSNGSVTTSVDAPPKHVPSPENGSVAANHQTAFREMLKHPSAQPVVTEIKKFIQQFPAGLSRNDASRNVHRFLSSTQEWMLSEVVVFAADADEEGRTNAAEGLEKFVICQLCRKHGRDFGVDLSDKEEDTNLHRQMAGLSWVTFSHLGAPPVDPALLGLAIQQLQSIENWKAPKDKLVCILNACRVIHDVLKRTRDEGGRPLAADDFLPLLIYVVIHANPPTLHSDIEFVATFRHPSRLVAEDAYFLTALQSAVAFAKEAGPKSLDVTAEEFQERFILAQSEALERESQKKEVVASPTTVAMKIQTLSPAQHAQLTSRVRALPLRFKSTLSARQLKIKDVAVLLDEYREMASILHDLDQPPEPLADQRNAATEKVAAPKASILRPVVSYGMM